MASRVRAKKQASASSAPPSSAGFGSWVPARLHWTITLVVIIGAAIAVYIPVLNGAFIWDDEPWISANPLVRGEGRSAGQTLATIWSGSGSLDYYPLTTTLNWLQWRLFGGDPAGFHTVNVLLHAANAVLVWRVLRAIGVPAAWLAGLIFAVHPVNAATAAWISETKNTLSLVFYLSSLLAFLRFEQTARVRWYVGALLLFTAGLLAKTHGVFIPAVLLLLAWWRGALTSFWCDVPADRRELCALRITNVILALAGFAAATIAGVHLWTVSNRFDGNTGDAAVLAAQFFADGRMRLIFPLLVAILFGSGCVGLIAAKAAGTANKHIVRTLAFFQLSALLGTTTIWFHGAVAEHIEMGGVARRLANAGSAMWWYVGKVFAPAELAAVYAPWRFDTPTVRDFLPLAGLIAIFVLLWCFRKTSARHAIFAFAAFALLVLPVVGLLTMVYARGGSIVADHLQYLPSIPLIAAVAAAAAWIWRRGSRWSRVALGLAVTVAIVAMSSSTWARAKVYRLEESLWRDTLAKNPDTWQGHNRLGQILFARGEFAAAGDHYQRAALLKPDLAPNHNNVGLALARQEKFEAAVAAYREAIARSPANAPSTATFRINLANALGAWANQIEVRTGALDDARPLYELAVAEYRAVVAVDERNATAHRNLGMVLVQLGRSTEGAEHLQETLRLVPNEPIATEILRELRSNP